MNASARLGGAALSATFLFFGVAAHAQSEPRADVADPSTIVVHVDTAGAALLPQRGRVPICSAPCEVRVPRDARYVIALDGHKAKVVLPTAPAAESVRVDVSIAAHSRAKVGAIVLGATSAFAGVLALSAFALDQAANGFSSDCSGWFCISDAAAGHLGATLLYGTSAFVGVVGFITGLVLAATPSKTAVARVSSTTAVKWTPTVDATPHGASVGLVGVF